MFTLNLVCREEGKDGGIFDQEVIEFESQADLECAYRAAINAAKSVLLPSHEAHSPEISPQDAGSIALLHAWNAHTVRFNEARAAGNSLAAKDAKDASDSVGEKQSREVRSGFIMLKTLRLGGNSTEEAISNFLSRKSKT
jgi:hypothetical protein